MRDFIRDVDRTQAQMLDSQNRVSTGRAILRPSDDPEAMSDILRLHADKSEALQYQRNVEFGKSRLEFTDTALDSLQSMLERVRTLGLSAIGAQTHRDAFVAEVEGLRDQFLGTVNTSFQGRFLFGGSDGDTLPFQKDGAGVVTYNGNSDVFTVPVGRVSSLQTQIPGSELFGAGNDVFIAMTDLITAMNSGVTSSIDAALKPLEIGLGRPFRQPESCRQPDQRGGFSVERIERAVSGNRRVSARSGIGRPHQNAHRVPVLSKHVAGHPGDWSQDFTAIAA